MNKINTQKGFTLPVAIALIVIVAAGAFYAASKAGPSSDIDGSATATTTNATSTSQSTPRTGTTATSKPATTSSTPKPAPAYNVAPGQAAITSISSLSTDGKMYSGGKILIKGRNLGVCNYPTTAVGCYIRASIGGREGAVVFGTADQTALTVDLPSLSAGTYEVFLQYPADKTRKQSNSLYITIAPVSKPVVTVTAPNGGEVVKIGSDITVSWKASGPLPKQYWTLVTLGSNTGGLIRVVSNVATESLTWTIPTKIQYKNTVVDLSPGAYKVTVGIYDGPICYAGCTAADANTGKLIVEDESDATFNIVGFNTNIY